MEVYDLIIIGGGCSGLALANALYELNSKKKVLVVDKRIAYQFDKIWSYWAPKNSYWANFADYKWKYCQFSLNEKDVVMHDYEDNLIYCSLSSLNYYKYSQSCFSHQNFTLKLNQHITSIEQKKHLFKINSKSDFFLSKKVVDLRSNPSSYNPLFYQIFYGVDVILKNSLSQSDQVRLMTNLCSTQDGIAFDYILPFSDKHILIEPTIFSKIKEFNIDYFKKRIIDICKKENIVIKDILREEQGILPMGQFKKKDKYSHEIGGVLRASSGYGFIKIQTWAKEFAYLFEKNNELKQIKYSKTSNFMDTIFLHYLKSINHNRDVVFYKLAKNMNYKIFYRLMSDQLSLLDCFKVGYSLIKR